MTYARLYWGGNLRVGEQKPPKDNGRVLIAEPGGAYKEVLADTVMGHRTAAGATDAFQASADVTELVRKSGAGLYTVAQVNVAMGHSAAGRMGRLDAGGRLREPAAAAARIAAVGRLRSRWDDRRSFGTAERTGAARTRPQAARAWSPTTATGAAKGLAHVSSGRAGTVARLGDAANPRERHYEFDYHESGRRRSGVRLHATRSDMTRTFSTLGPALRSRR